MDRKPSLNGGIAYREGWELKDNPFDMVSRRQSHEDWRRQFLDEQRRRVGPSAYDDKI